MNNIRWLLVIFSLLILLGSSWFSWQKWRSAQSGEVDEQNCASLQSVADHSQTEIRVGEQVLQVEVVNTSASITQGLSGRSKIGSDGLLFVLVPPRTPGFWMKEMQFNLDLIWISQGQVVQVDRGVAAPDPSQRLNELPVYRPAVAVDFVLEVVAGQAEAWGIEPGKKISCKKSSV
ncbi:MAG: hypothetical protein GF390_02860 [Candidatus Pacebacteria bacterium]|nr:hypothetical protein [Candidatus Paceibacterota bacterium]